MVIFKNFINFAFVNKLVHAKKIYITYIAKVTNTVDHISKTFGYLWSPV